MRCTKLGLKSPLMYMPKVSEYIIDYCKSFQLPASNRARGRRAPLPHMRHGGALRVDRGHSVLLRQEAQERDGTYGKSHKVGEFHGMINERVNI